MIDCSPLGTAAGYGVNLPLDRDGVAGELGFGRIQVNPMYTQNSRGKFEIMALQAASHAMQDVRRLAWDLSLFTTSEFDFVSLPEQYTTGSSIMPNKSNPDVVELLRGRVATIEGAVMEIQSVLSLPSGYQRDLQLTKAPLIRGLKAAMQALAIVPPLVSGMQFKERKYAGCDFSRHVRHRHLRWRMQPRVCRFERLTSKPRRSLDEAGRGGCRGQPRSTGLSGRVWRPAAGPDQGIGWSRKFKASTA